MILYLKIIMKQMILVIGPESSATRAIALAFSNHSEVLSLGPSNDSIKGNNHADLLDDVWYELEQHNIDKAINLFPRNPLNKIILTRRSVPHGLKPGQNAEYMSFPKLDLLKDLCDCIRYDLFILITSRSPIPNLMSWTNRRQSVQGDFRKAFDQYQMSYKRIFDFVQKRNVNYLILSAEGLVLDKENYIRSLHSFFGLKSNIDISMQTKTDINSERYEEYFKKIV